MSSINVKLLILVSILIMGINGKFSEEPDYEFPIWDESKTGKLVMIDLSTDDDQLAVISFDQSSLRYFMTVYNFDGTIVCEYDYPMQYYRVGWASQTGGFYLDVVYKYILKSITPCGDPQYLASQRGYIQGITFTYTSKQSSVAFAYNNNQVVEYDLGSGAVLKQFDFDNSTEKLKSIQFTPEHEFLYSVVTTNENKSKVIIFDADSGERKSQIQTDLQFVKENSKHDGFIGTDKDQVNFYNVEKDGNPRQIWTPSTDPYADEAPVQVCTNDIRIMALRISGSKENSKYEMISYDSDDGSNLQTFQLNFIPNLNIQNPFRCNDNYLSIFDTEGKIHIFKYSRPLPVWAIILIVIGSLFIIGGFIGAGIFIYKKKQNSQKLGKYQQFNMQEKTRNDL